MGFTLTERLAGSTKESMRRTKQRGHKYYTEPGRLPKIQARVDKLTMVLLDRLAMDECSGNRSFATVKLIHEAMAARKQASVKLLQPVPAFETTPNPTKGGH